MGMGRACSTDGANRNTYKTLVGKPEKKRHLGRPRCRWGDNIKLIFERYDELVWTESIWLRIGTSGGLL
jgi:hypothetical protein